MHWKDLKDENENWLGLEVSQKETTKKETLKLYSGGNRRLKVCIQDKAVLYASFDLSHQESWALRTNNSDFKVIDQIQSSEVELAQKSEFGREQYWTRFFAKKLFTHDFNLTSHSRFRLRCLNSEIKKHQTNTWSGTGTIYDSELSFTKSPFRMVDWMISSNAWSLITLKDEAHIELGKLKWWRKKVIESAIPPVLTYFIPTLDSYIVLDGHLRLQACLLEKSPIPFITVETILEEQIPGDPEWRAQLHKNIEARNNHKWKKPLSVDAMNKFLVLGYDSSYTRRVTYSKGNDTKDFEEKWLNEVLAYETNDLKKDPDFQNFIAGRVLYSSDYK